MPTQECLSRVFQAVTGGFRVAYSALEAQSGAAARDDSMARLKSAYPQVTFASGEIVPTVGVDAPRDVVAAETEEPSTRSKQKNR